MSYWADRAVRIEREQRAAQRELTARERWWERAKHDSDLLLLWMAYVHGVGKPRPDDPSMDEILERMMREAD